MLRRLVSFAAALLLFLGAALPVSAATPTVGTGTVGADYSTAVGGIVRQADGNAFVEYTVQGNYTGTITGRYFETGVQIIHPDGTMNVSGMDVCSSCTVGGRTGTLTALFQGVVVNGVGRGSWVISGSGGLAGFHAEGNWSGTLGTPLGYTIKYHFDPE